jgi:para-nitrobenzyl esterase
MGHVPSRRTFVKQASLLVAGVHFAPWLKFVAAADLGSAVADTSAGRVRGVVIDGVNVFKGIPYGASTSGKNRFRAPVKPTPWTGTRDALAYGATAPQTSDNSGTTAAGSPIQQSEDCLVLNVFTPGLKDSRKRPVMVWLHGGGFSSGSGSGRILDGTSLAHAHDVVTVTLNHRLNVFGYTHLGDAMGSEFAASSSVGLLDIVAALEWVRDNIAEFGGDPNLVTIFGQSGGGRKVATLMAMPGAKGLFRRAIIESGAVLRLTAHEDAVKQTDLLLAELGLKAGQIRELQNRIHGALAGRRCRRAEEVHNARAGNDGEHADGRRQGHPFTSLGSQSAVFVGEHSVAHRVCAHRRERSTTGPHRKSWRSTKRGCGSARQSASAAIPSM